MACFWPRSPRWCSPSPRWPSAVSLGQRKNRQKGELQLTDLGEQYREMQRDMRTARMDTAEQKVWLKQFKKQTKADDKLKKQRAKSGAVEVTKPCLYVLDFKGSMDAHEVTSLREGSRRCWR